MNQQVKKVLLDKKELPQGKVHIWTINLDQEDRQVAKYRRILSVDENKRSARFHFERHRRRYTISHGALRCILGAYLDTDPAALDFDQSDHGKPALAGAHKTTGLHFNLTHSHEIALLAVVSDFEIGIDVEYVKKMGNIDGIAGRFFSTAEQKSYLNLPEDLKPQGFFNCWTRKEAFIKAIGEGLSHPLHQFDVSLTPSEPAKLLRVGSDPSEASYWTLDAFYPTPEYTAAVALRAKQIEFIKFQYHH